MEIKDLFLLMLIPILLVSIIVYTDKSPAIIGAVTSQQTQQEESNIIGTYSIMPSFKAKIDYNLEEYKNIDKELNNVIENCKNGQDIEQCFKDKSVRLEWNCAENDEGINVLYDFVDKFNECLNLEENGVVCRFSLGERKIKDSTFNIKLTVENQKIKAELIENNKILETAFINQDNLLYLDEYNDKDKTRKIAEVIIILIEYQGNKPVIKNVIKEKDSNKEKDEEVLLSKIFLLYKSSEGVTFIDAQQEDNFRASPPNKIIDLPRIKGFKFCAKGKNQIYAYDESDKTVKLRDIIYKFAVTYPKQILPPKPIENLEVFDALKAENTVILMWDKSNEPNIKSYSAYYSTKDFIDAKTEDIKKDNTISKKIMPNNPIEIKDVEIKNCVIDPIGTPCKYLIYGSSLEKDKLYYLSSKNKFIYLITDVKDNIEYNFAITAINEEEIEINNDKSIKDNNYVLTSNKNYKKFTSIDDLAPNKVSELKYESIEVGKIRLKWNKPLTNIDGSSSADITGFEIYYKKNPLILPQEFDKIDASYTKLKTITTLDANCELMRVACEYIITALEEGLVNNQIYNLAIVAVDKYSNRFIDNAEVVRTIVS